MRTDHLTLDELERHAYVTGDLRTASACRHGLDTEQERLDDARDDGYEAGHSDGYASGYESGADDAARD